MSYEELVTPPQIERDEVRSLVGLNTALTDLSPLEMSPLLEEWKTEKKNYDGELIIPKEIVKGSECVVWIRRVGYDPETLEDYDFYQIGCEHLPGAEAAGDGTTIFACNSLKRALTERAQKVDKAFHHTDTLVQYVKYNPVSHGLRLGPSGKTMAEAYILGLLDHTAHYPEVWIGNHLGGVHSTALLALSMGLEHKEVLSLSKRLESKGLLEFTSDTNVQLASSYKDFLRHFGDAV